MPSLMEGQVYRSVAILFKNEPDLLSEFSRFLPDASCFATCEQPQQQSDSSVLKVLMFLSFSKFCFSVVSYFDFFFFFFFFVFYCALLLKALYT